MSLNLPSENETPLCKCRVLYLGTTYYTNTTNDGNIKINLKLIQDTIAKRYPVNGEKFSEGIDTLLSIFPSGIQFEHSKITTDEDASTTSDGTFFFPIKSLVYCGALRLIRNEKAAMTDIKWKFVPLDSELASDAKNLRNPPLYVSIVRGVDPSSKGENIECHVFVIGMKKTAMRLVECSQKAYNGSNQSVTQFRNKYGNVPAVFTSSDTVNGATVVKKHDKKGFFYVINESAIDLWQLYETDNNTNSDTNGYQSPQSIGSINSDNWRLINNQTRFIENTEILDPYQDAPNLVKVERSVDPRTGQNIYVRWLADDPQIEETRIIERERIETPSPAPPPLIIRETGPTPEPIIVEKIIQKKKPQLIIKEIHVNEPAPPPIKVVEEILTDSNSTIFEPKTIYKRTPSKRRTVYNHHVKYSSQPEPVKVKTDYSFFNKHPDYYSHHRGREKKDLIYNTNDVYNMHRKQLYQPLNNYYYSSSVDNYLYESPLNMLDRKPRRPHHVIQVSEPIYSYHRRHRHHHGSRHRTPEPHHHHHHDNNHHHHHHHDKHHHRNNHHHHQIPTAKVDEVVFRKKSGGKSEMNGSKQQKSPSPQQTTAKSKEYRKVFVANDDDARQNNIKSQSPLKQQHQNNYIYGNAHAPISNKTQQGLKTNAYFA